MSPLNPKMVETSWNNFANLLLPNAPEAQRDAMRTAFFSGAALMFQLQGDISEKLEEEKAMQAMSYLHEELARFGRVLDATVMENIPPKGTA